MDKQEVVVVDIKMPFLSMVAFMVKWVDLIFSGIYSEQYSLVRLRNL